MIIRRTHDRVRIGGPHRRQGTGGQSLRPHGGQACQCPLHLIRLEHRHEVKLEHAAVVGKVRRPPGLGRGIPILINQQVLPCFHPEAVRMVFRIQLAEPPVISSAGNGIAPADGILRHEVGHRGLINVHLDAAGASQVIPHHIGRTVGQHFQITEIFCALFICKGIRQRDIPSICRAQPAIIRQGGCRNAGVPVAEAVILIPADGGDQNMVIVQIEPRFIGILAYPRVVLALQRTVLPDLVADEPAFVIILVAPFLIDAGKGIQIVPFHQQAFPVGLGGRAVRGLRSQNPVYFI